MTSGAAAASPTPNSTAGSTQWRRTWTRSVSGAATGSPCSPTTASSSSTSSSPALDAGAICVLLNWRLTVTELEYILNDSSPMLLVHDARVRRVGRGVAAALFDRRAAGDRRWLAGQPVRERARRFDGQDGVERGRPHPRRRDHDHVHVRHDRAAEGGDDHPRHELLELGQPRASRPASARHGAPERAAAVPHRRAELLLQPGAPRRRHRRDPEGLRSRRDAPSAGRPGPGHHPFLRRAGAVPVHDAAPRLRRHRPVAPEGGRGRRCTVRADDHGETGPSAVCC